MILAAGPRRGLHNWRAPGAACTTLFPRFSPPVSSGLAGQPRPEQGQIPPIRQIFSCKSHRHLAAQQRPVPKADAQPLRLHRRQQITARGGIAGEQPHPVRRQGRTIASEPSLQKLPQRLFQLGLRRRSADQYHRAAGKRVIPGKARIPQCLAPQGSAGQLGFQLPELFRFGRAKQHYRQAGQQIHSQRTEKQQQRRNVPIHRQVVCLHILRAEPQNGGQHQPRQGQIHSKVPGRPAQKQARPLPSKGRRRNGQRAAALIQKLCPDRKWRCQKNQRADGCHGCPQTPSRPMGRRPAHTAGGPQKEITDHKVDQQKRIQINYRFHAFAPCPAGQLSSEQYMQPNRKSMSQPAPDKKAPEGQPCCTFRGLLRF